MALSPRAQAITAATIAIVAIAVSLWQLHDSAALRAGAPTPVTPSAVAPRPASPVVQARLGPHDGRAVPPTDVWRHAPPSPARAESTRQAVALAVRAPSASSGDRRDAMLQALADSGRADPVRAATITARATRWHDALDPDIAGAVQIGAVRCYRGGCAVEVAFATDDAYQMAREHLRRLPADADDGGRLQTPAIPRGDGWLVADWIALEKE